MKQFNSMVKSVIGLALLANLTGCAMTANKHAMELACDYSPVLYTNLKKPVYARRYALPNGQACPVLLKGNADV